MRTTRLYLIAAVASGLAIFYVLQTIMAPKPVLRTSDQGQTVEAEQPAVSHCGVESLPVGDLAARIDRLHRELERLAERTESTHAAIKETTALAQQALDLGLGLEGRVQMLTDINGMQAAPFEEDKTDAVAELSLELMGDKDSETHFETLASVFDAQTKDTTWSSAAVGVIEDSFAAESLSGSTLISTECRNSLCRASVEHDSDDEVSAFEFELPLAVSEHFNSFIMAREQLGNGWYGTTVYFVRQGYSAPLPDI